MYLKKIEVQGFKSFANKLVFEFNQGITGIVGPNGSGKSNIADAVRWVLGEQSAKQLRGAKMEDVIFAGTETRKPVGFAGVSITIDNSDHQLDIEYDELTVTRRVFRSGESEYIINGAPCRLKDINEIFYDTGIGKEGYSIIGQGQIDKILSGKPEERRELFDEAAGIVKYKRRKITAQKKLDDESQNLVRVNDILTELEKQVGPLSRQSEKAKEYMQYREELKKYDVNLFLVESETLKNKFDEVVSKYDIADNDLKTAREEYENIKRIYDEKALELTDINNRVEDITASLNTAEIDRNKLINNIELLKEQIKSVMQNDEHLTGRIDSINEQIGDREEEKQRLLTEKFKLNDEIDEMSLRKSEADTEITEMTNKLDELNKSVEDKKNDIIDKLNEKASIKTKIQRLETMLEQINIRKAELTRKIISNKTDEGSNESELERLKKEIDIVNEEINSITNDNKVLDDSIINIRTKITETEAGMSQTHQDNIRAKSKLESLKNITERYEGYGQSIRKVMELKDHKEGILGVVADLIKVNKEYEVAIETALGGSIQNIVTDSDITAKELINYLKTNKYGRATFLPLNNINYKTLNGLDKIRGEQGVIGIASELVETEKRFIPLAEYLLGRIIVTDNIDNAIKLNRKNNFTLRIVTADGELLNPGGSMTGGAFKNNSNLLGRRREITDLEETIAQLDKSYDVYKTESAKLRGELTEKRQQSEDNKKLLQEKLIIKNTSELNCNQTKEKGEQIRNLYIDNKRESEEIENQVAEINSSLNEIRAILDEVESDSNTITSEIESMTAESEKLKSLLSEKTKAAEELHLEYANMSQKNSFAEENVKRVLREISRLKDGIGDIQDSLNDAKAEVQYKQDEINSINETIELAGQKIDEYNNMLSGLKTDRDSKTESQKEFFSKREELSNNLVTLEKEVYRLESQKEKLEETRDSRIDYMWNEYELTLNMASKYKDDSIVNIDDMKKNISSLKGKIKSLGDVNVNAIEDYKEISERYEFMKTQHDDLITARETLIKIIDELDEGMRTQFKEKFEEIRVEFDKVFKNLFGGGKGTIELEEDVDILEAGIRIVSQPPGKKLQNMMQLSGGEKALTAISLLFAIQNLKPSPFCLLDEIEAALDDNNVARYAKYLHNLTNHTQFIVITHRRGTMAAADRLYGITMQEKGVSTLVSVDLIENQLEEDKIKAE